MFHASLKVLFFFFISTLTPMSFPFVTKDQHSEQDLFLLIKSQWLNFISSIKPVSNYKDCSCLQQSPLSCHSWGSIITFLLSFNCRNYPDTRFGYVFRYCICANPLQLVEEKLDLL